MRSLFSENQLRRMILILCIVLVGCAAGALLLHAHTPLLSASAETGTEVTAEVDGSEEQDNAGSKAIAAGIAIGLAAGAAAIGMGIAVARSSEAISRQPEAEGKIRSSMMIGLVFVETAIIYAFVVAILIVFAL